MSRHLHLEDDARTASATRKPVHRAMSSVHFLRGLPQARFPGIAQWCQNSSIVRFLRIDPMVSGLSPIPAKISLRVRRVSVIPGVGNTRCGHIEKKDLDTAR